jgi:biotin carboxyl carrier protein
MARYVQLTKDKARPTIPVEVEALGDDRYRVTIDGVTRELIGYLAESGLTTITDDRVRDFHVVRAGDVYTLSGRGGQTSAEIVDERTWQARSVLGGGAGTIKPQLASPMAGKVVMVRVAVGDRVHEGQPLVIVEAMKMENELRAGAVATIKAVRVTAGQVVNPGDVLLEFDLDAV